MDGAGDSDEPPDADGRAGAKHTRGRGPAARHAPQVLGALVRRYGHFDAAEDAVQEALLAAAGSGRAAGVPDNPRGWLIKVASRRLTDMLRSDRRGAARGDGRRAHTARRLHGPAAGRGRAPREDDTLTLLFLCCHPALSPPAQIALTLRAVGGLTTAEIARAYLVPEATMAQRISRAKQKCAGVRFGRPDRRETAAAGRAPGPVPDLQRGLHGHLRRHPAARATSPARRSG